MLSQDKINNLFFFKYKDVDIILFGQTVGDE